MKAFLMTLLCLPLLSFAQSNMVAYKPKNIVLPAGADVEKVKDLANQAIQELVNEFAAKASGLPASRFAVLPLKRDLDDGYITLQLQNRLSAVGSKAKLELYTRDDATLNALLAEIQWGQDFGDTMEQATIQKFGRIAGVQGIIFSRLDVTQDEHGALTVRVNMQAYEVETGRTLWGEEKKAETSFLDILRHSIRGHWKTIVAVIAGLLILLWLRARIRRALRPR